jgi:hypothetical protein
MGRQGESSRIIRSGYSKSLTILRGSGTAQQMVTVRLSAQRVAVGQDFGLSAWKSL